MASMTVVYCSRPRRAIVERYNSLLHTRVEFDNDGCRNDEAYPTPEEMPYQICDKCTKRLAAMCESSYEWYRTRLAAEAHGMSAAEALKKGLL